MLLVALLLLLAAVGLLVMSFATSATWWAWASIAVSGLAAAVLVARWWWARRRRAAASGRHRGVRKPAIRTALASEPGAAPAPAVEEPVPGDGVAAAPSARAPSARAPSAEAPSEGASADGIAPAEEETDAADLLVVCELEDEVLVVDEHPRYHLAGCGWLGSRAVEQLAASEARSLGFTPCARCGPDAELADRHRRSRLG
jgi:hypothetical protein